MTYRDRIGSALAEGYRFASLYASVGGVVRVALISPGGALRLESVEAQDGRVPTIVDLTAAAGWAEREAADLYGLAFDGHEPLRPLVGHDLELAHWTVPVRGDDAYQVAVGPIHAGVIESGHFRFHVVGDRILHLDARLFYKHRGLERAAEGRPLEDGLAYAQRACAACAVSNSVAYAHACEQTHGLRASSELARVRTILLELERTWNHLNDIAAVCAGAGLAAGNTFFASLTERARRLNEQLTGHRFLFGSVQIGGSRLSLTAAAVATAREELASIATDSKSGWRELLFNASFQDRLPDIGTVSADDAQALGAVGPAARASGLAIDARTHAVGLAYNGLTPVAPRRVAGDVEARLEQRAVELLQTYDLLDGLLDRQVNPSAAEPGDRGRAIGLGVVESPRGATLCAVEQAAGRIERLHLRTGSYANWPVVAHAAAGNLLARLPPDQQELRTLLRLRRPLMLTLLRNLHRLRGNIALPRPERGRSLTLRHVDAGSCNGCEHELTLASSPYEDVQRYGFSIVASPRHADVLLVTGTVTTRMREPLLTAYHAMPEPRRVVALGDCALARGVLAADTEIVGPVEALLPVDLRIPGCPPSPATITQALLELHDAGNRPQRTEQ